MTGKTTPETMKKLRAMARAGYTREQAAQAVGLSYGHLCHLVRRYGAPFRQASLKKTPAKPRRKSPIQHIKASGLLADMTMAEKQDVLLLIRKGRMSAVEALTAVKRPDLAARVDEFL